MQGVPDGRGLDQIAGSATVDAFEAGAVVVGAGALVVVGAAALVELGAGALVVDPDATRLLDEQPPRTTAGSSMAATHTLATSSGGRPCPQVS